MGGLLDEYRRYYESQTESILVWNAIRDAIYPFDPGTVSLVLEEHIDTKILHVSFQHWPDLGTTVNISNFDLVAYPEMVYYEIARRVAENLRDMEYITPESNHILGEN